MGRVWAWVAVGAGALIAALGTQRVLGKGWITWRLPVAARYQVTADDTLWLQRAVNEEAKSDDDRYRVAQTLVNGFAAIKAYGRGGTLAGYVRAYAQPINPRWFENGDLFQAEIAHPKYSAEDRAVLRERARKREYVYSKRTVFDPGTTDAVTRALADGPVNIPRSATDYGAYDLDASPRLTPLTPPVKGENRLWTARASWPGYGVG